MKIQHKAVAGSLESNDIMVMVEPNANNIEIELESSVYHFFGENIKEAISDEINRLGVKAVSIKANDRGALECTIRARVETALKRACNEENL